MAGIVISVVGLGGLVLADLLSGRNTDDPGGENIFLSLHYSKAYPVPKVFFK